MFSKTHAIFWEKAQPVLSNSTDPQKPLFFGHTIAYMQTWVKLETTFKSPQGPKVYSKVPFVKFEKPNSKAIGDNHMVSGSVFFVSSDIFVLRCFLVALIFFVK